MNILTFLRFLSVSCSLTGGTIPATSIVGTTSSFKNLFMLRDFANIRFILKHESSKWAEHSTDVLIAWKLGLCFVDKIYPFPSCLESVSLGNRCMDIPLVCWLLAQLTKFGPSATQRLPARGGLSLLILHAMSVLVSTSQNQNMAAKKFAQEVSKIASLEGYRIGLKWPNLILFSEHISGRRVLLIKKIKKGSKNSLHWHFKYTVPEMPQSGLLGNTLQYSDRKNDMFLSYCLSLPLSLGPRVIQI